MYIPTSPSLQVGQSTCQLEFYNTSAFEYTCQYPGANSPEETCEAIVNATIAALSGAFVGQGIDFAAAAQSLGKILPPTITSEIIRALLLYQANQPLFNALEYMFKKLPALTNAIALVSIIQSVISAPGADLAPYTYTLLYNNQPLDISQVVEF